MKDLPLPHNIDLEQKLLGSLIADPDQIYVVDGILPVGAEAFYRTAHQKIYGAIKSMVAEGRPIDLTTLYDEVVRKHKALKGSELVAIAEASPTGQLTEHYALRLAEKYARRKAVQVFDAAMRDVVDESKDIHDVVSAAERELDNALPTAGRRQVSSIHPEIVDVWEHYLDVEDGKEPDWFKSGFIDLDRICHLSHGIHILVGGRPGMGKTSFALCLARNFAKQGKRPVFFTLEQPRGRILKKIISQEARVSHSRFLTGRLGEDEKKRVSEAMGRIGKYDIGIFDGSFSVAEIRSKVIQEQREHGCDAVIVDLLHKLKPPQGMSRAETHIMINENTKLLESLGIDTTLPVLTMAHLNRDLEKRDNKRPLLTDIREAGEEFADAVWFLYRDEYYYEGTKEPGICEVIVAKNRDGPTGTVKLTFDDSSTTFDNVADEERWWE